MRIRQLCLMVAGVAAAAVFNLWASPVMADDCDGHCYTIAWQGGAQLAGVQATRDVQELAAGDWPSGGFAVQDINHQFRSNRLVA